MCILCDAAIEGNSISCLSEMGKIPKIKNKNNIINHLGYCDAAPPHE